MVDVTLSRGSTSVTLPVIRQGGTPAIACDKGKPELRVEENQGVDPRVLDEWSQIEQYNIQARFFGDSAYDDAIDLADLIKEPSGGTPLEAAIPLPEYPNTAEVAPSAGSNEAVNLVYRVGGKNWVDVDLGLTRVDETQGTDFGTASTPTASGSGPIEIKHNGNVVSVTSDARIGRTVGRPNSQISRRTSTFPTYIDGTRSAYDVFDVSFQSLNGISDIQTLRGIVETRLGRDAMTLDFNGIYNLGEFDVVPTGSSGFRHVRRTGYNAVGNVPSLTLRVVRTE